MTGSIKDGGPAFPVNRETFTRVGMSLRDYFAGHALAGLLAADAKYGGRTDNREALAADAYGFADAMLAAREATR